MVISVIGSDAAGTTSGIYNTEGTTTITTDGEFTITSTADYSGSTAYGIVNRESRNVSKTIITAGSVKISASGGVISLTEGGTATVEKITLESNGLTVNVEGTGGNLEYTTMTGEGAPSKH